MIVGWVRSGLGVLILLSIALLAAACSSSSRLLREGQDEFAAATFWVASTGTVIGLHRCGDPSVDGAWDFLLPPLS